MSDIRSAWNAYLAEVRASVCGCRACVARRFVPEEVLLHAFSAGVTAGVTLATDVVRASCTSQPPGPAETYAHEHEAVAAAQSVRVNGRALPVLRPGPGGLVHIWKDGAWRHLTAAAHSALREVSGHVEVYRDGAGWRLAVTLAGTEGREAKC